MKKIFFTGVIALTVISCSKKENSAIQSSESADISVSAPAAQPLTGDVLMSESGCVACHNPESRTVGPSYKELATKYENTPENVALLAGKILNGSVGVWGEVPMPAHPQIGEENAKIIATYLLSQK